MKSLKSLKHKSLLVDLAIIVIVAIGFGLFIHWHNQPKLKTANRTYKLLVAKTAAQQTKGLGGRANLPTDQAMVFVFNGEGERCIWMKDMHFPLDIIWTNSQEEVVALQQNVSPKTYPEAFCPSSPAEYVLELNAGQIKAAGIYTGQRLSF